MDLKIIFLYFLTKHSTHVSEIGVKVIYQELEITRKIKAIHGIFSE